MTGRYRRQLEEIRRVYREIDRSVRHVKMATGLRCVSGCGDCCARGVVEATVLEALPVARRILITGQAETLLPVLEERIAEDNPVCALHQPDPPVSQAGHCLFYSERMLLCRLFGFSARRNKYGSLELAACRIVRETMPEAVKTAQSCLAKGINVPVYQDLSMRIASIDPAIGFHSLPVNQAIHGAIHRLSWERPFRPHWARAA